MNNNYQISVIIPTYNRLKIIKKLIPYWILVDKETNYKYELIFSDDGSVDDTLKYLESKKNKLPIKLIKNNHGGASNARNSGIKEASGDLILFLGDDIFPSPNIINIHYEEFIKNGGNCAILGDVEWHKSLKVNHLMKHITEIGCEQFSYSKLKNNSFVDYRHFYTCNISIPRFYLASETVLFDKRFNEYGFEDIELGYRLFKKGLKIKYLKMPNMQHLHPYDVHSFIKRQISAGKMSYVFMQKHPELDFLGQSEKMFKQNKFDDYNDDFKNLINFSNRFEDYIAKQKVESKIEYEPMLSYIYLKLFAASYQAGFFMKKLKDESMSKAIYSYYLDQFNPIFLKRIDSNKSIKNFLESKFDYYDIFKFDFFVLNLRRFNYYIYLLLTNPFLFFIKLKLKFAKFAKFADFNFLKFYIWRIKCYAHLFFSNPVLFFKKMIRKLRGFIKI